jgi:predicted PurR-regulated permease PerM/GNAT superfamily N-acetyltransferase
MSESTARWDSTTKRIVTLILLSVLVIIVYRFRIVLPPLIIAFLLAFILDPAVDFLEDRVGLSRTLATALVFLLLILVAAAAPAVAVPPIVRAIRSLNLDFVQILDDLDRLAAQPIVFLGQEWDLLSVYQQLRETLMGFISTVATGTVDVVVGFASTLFWVIFILLSAFYMIRDKKRIVEWIDSLVPPSFRPDFIELRERITGVWHAFLRGQLIMGLLLALMTMICATIIGLPNALALALLAGAMEFIPNLGPVIAAVPAVAVALFEGSIWIPLSNFWFAVLVLGLYLVIQQIEGNILLPRVLGRSLDLHPLIVLIAVIAGGSLAGILGMLLAAPTVATLRVLMFYIYRRLTDENPFPREEKYRPQQWIGRRVWNRIRRRALAERWVIRPVSPGDRAEVETVCSHIWDGTDYIPKVWDEWVADPVGEFTVLDLDGQVVALSKLTHIADGEWWLEGLRVDPAYRRLGIARALQDYHVELAERAGNGVIRFGTASYNVAVRKNAAHDGFTHVSSFVPFEASPLPGICPLRQLSRDDLDAAWEMIADSPVKRAAGGLYEISWRWLPLTRERFTVHVDADEVWGIEIGNELAALAFLPNDPEREKLFAGYVDGSEEGITALALGLRVLAHQKGYEALRLRVPFLPTLMEAIETAGATRSWEHELMIFERNLSKGETDNGESND